MSRRTLGGGRVLGTPSALSAPSPSPQPKRVLSPAASSVSLSSQTSVSQFSSTTQDLTSRISLENGNTSISAPPAAPGAQLSCPICSEEMVTLLQLNRHLDDLHQNLEDGTQDEVKDWFKIQMEKAKRFQPLAVLNQKLKGLDVFESNENQASSVSSRPLASHSHIPTPNPRNYSTPKTSLQRNTGKLLMKLSRSAHHEPIRGIWARVCETCYKSREGYNDHNGASRDKMASFKSIRQQMVDKDLLEVSRLEKRLTRLTQLLASLPPDQVQPSATKLFSIGWQSDQRKTLEQTVVSWQDDASVSRCPFCQQDFSGYSFRRHHCRTCGRVVCGDVGTGCSSEVGLSITPGTLLILVVSGRLFLTFSIVSKSSEKVAANNLLNIDVRLCKDCKSTLFDRRDFEADITHKPPEARSYDNLIQFERGIRLHLPEFQKLLSALQDPRRPPSSAQIADASKVRKRLMDSFAKYDVAARRIRDLPTNSPTQQRLQKAIYQQASSFLHLHMLPLKALPKVLKHAPSNGGRMSSPATSSPNTPVNGSPAPGAKPQDSALASIKYNNRVAASGSTSSLASDTSSAKFFVSEMIADANRRRKFDEVSSLAVNVEDLSREIDRVNGMLAGLDFEGVYTGNLQASA
ncbi:Zinc finger FYVE/PHD-type [Penicillium cosmopolitanum]|uniref:Zinc finger FYVE/PHD-type n=1 Tax=Penicillium cosmopolitanum TaxID=1131564 RepID=A0A9W9W1H0_9EURO|nr:Zinc finger FYVE/PHD-type [Penicillium cosmopolitanum]KAJ5396953.1 Zinc finger FYVE/PHD-type [Penicillium cosmopolitanum]